MARGPRHSWAHRQARTWYLSRTPPGTPCAYGPRCLYPPHPAPLTGHPKTWDLAHNDHAPGTYLGMAHRKCNRTRQRESPFAKGNRLAAPTNERATRRRARKVIVARRRTKRSGNSARR